LVVVRSGHERSSRYLLPDVRRVYGRKVIATSRGAFVSGWSARHCLDGLLKRQRDDGPSTNIVTDLDGPMVRVHDFTDDGKAEA
jgi:hypothetical protein